MSAQTVFDREFLGLRARLIDIAATLDRVARAEGSLQQDPRWEQIRRGLQVLLDASAERAAQVQEIFSLPYQEDWQRQYGLPTARPDAKEA